MRTLNYINKRNYQLQLEKLIIGVEEPIFIKGIGTVLAKADSGNSAFNVLHGEDFYYQGGTVVFTTFDEEGKQHRVSKKVQTTVSINIGAGHTEERPVVLMDVKFANDEYLNVPFTVGNRSNNKNKVLLGKEFLTNELDVLIDVSQDNISDKNIEIDMPISEASNQEQGENNIVDARQSANPSGAATTAKKAYQAAKGISKGAYDFLKIYSTTGQDLKQGYNQVKAAWNEMMDTINDYQRTDKELIFKFLSEEFMNASQPMDTVFNNPQVIKLLDWLGNDYAGNNNLNEKLESPTNEPYERKDVKVAEAVETPIQKNTKTYAKAKKAINDKLKTIVYLVLYNGEQLEQAKQLLSAEYPNFSGNFNQLINSAAEIAESPLTNNIAANIIEKFKANNISGAIVRCSGIKESRDVRAITSLFDSIVTGNKDDADNKTEEPKLLEYNPDVEDAFGNKLAEQVFDYKSVDDKMLREFFIKHGANPNLVYSYTLFAFTDKAKAYEYEAKDINIRKNVILYYYVNSNLRPDNSKIGKEFDELKETIKNIVKLFDIESISEGVKHYVSRFIDDMRENGCLGVCFGDFTDRSGFFLNGKTKQEDVVNPKLISYQEPISEKPIDVEEVATPDKKVLRAKEKKAASGKRARAWKSVLNKLPESMVDFSSSDFDKLYFAVNKITKGENNYSVPLPTDFKPSKKTDPKIRFISRKDNVGIIKREGKNNRLMTYNIRPKAGKLYISLVDSKEISQNKNKEVTSPVPEEKPEVIKKEPISEVKPVAEPVKVKETPEVKPKTEVEKEKTSKKPDKKIIDAEITEPVKQSESNAENKKKKAKKTKEKSVTRTFTDFDGKTVNIIGNTAAIPDFF